VTIETSLPTDAQSLREYTRERWRAFVEFTDSLPDDVWEGPTDAAGWTVKDHVAHVVLWDESLVGLVRDRAPRRETLKVTDLAWNAGGYDLLNEEIRFQTERDPVSTVKARRDAGWQEIEALLASFDDVDVQKPGSAFGLMYGSNGTLLETLVDDLGVQYDQHHQYIRAIVEGGSA
jgi:hypothetical protein